MKTVFKGKIVFEGKSYECEVINGERFIEGKTVHEFFKTLSPSQQIKFARIGKMALEDEARGIKPPKNKYQYYLSEQE